jgi:hypothetical protein
MDGGQTVFNPLFSKKTSVIFSLCCVVEALIKAKKAPSVLTLQVIQWQFCVGGNKLVQL